MKNTDELAVIFKVTIKNIIGNNQVFEYIPVGTVEGRYDEEDKVFIDKNNTIYRHIIDEPENFGFCYRINSEEVRKKYPYMPSYLVKSLLYKESKKYTYILGEEANSSVPVILITPKNSNETNIMFDRDITLHYLEKYPELLKNYLNVELENTTKKDNKDASNVISNVDINRLYTELSENVINQDEPIKKILTAIWKQYGNFSDSKSRNILINGSTGVGKTEIFRIISKMIDVPCVIASATQYSATAYQGKNVEDMLVNLIVRANGDLSKAERGILIIDEVDKLAQASAGSSVNQRDVQEGLLKIVEDGIYTVTYNGIDYDFNTGKLMVIAMGSWTRIELKEEKAIGFGKESKKKSYKDLTREDLIANGMIPDFIGRFSTIVQMNELDYQSLLEILNRGKQSILKIEKEFFQKKGIELVVDDETKKAIALKASTGKYGARSLDETIETALSIASFEIATNPNSYDKLIVTPETITDNKKYTLVRKKKNN